MTVLLLLLSCLAGVPSDPDPGVALAVTRQSPAARGEGRVEGRVLDPGSRGGIGGIQLRLDGREVDVTAEDGTFALPSVAAGRHRIDATLPGFAISPAVELVVEDGKTTVVEVEYHLAATTEVVGTLRRPAEPAPGVARAVLTGHEISGAVGGLEDVSRVLQLRPGVLASQDDRNDIMVRGGGPIETGVIIDGFEAPTASHFAQPGSSGGGVSLFAPVVVGQATLYTGGFSVAHGERSSSILDIDLRGIRPKGVGGVVSAGAGGVLALVEGAHPSGGWMAAVRRSILEVAFQRDELRAVPRYHDVVARGLFAIGPRHQARLLVLNSAESAEVTATPTTDLDEMHEEQDLLLVGLGLRSEWGARTRSSISLSRSEARLDAYGGSGGTVDGFDRSRETEWRLRAEVRRQFAGKAEVLAGATMKRADLRFDMENGGYRNPWGNTVAPVFVHQRDRFTDAAGYLELSAPLHRTLLATGGWRVDRWGGSGATTGSPRVGLEYRPWQQVSVGAGGGVYRQAIPHVWSQSHPDNRTLQPIRCVQGNLGVQAWGRAGRVAVEGFVKRYEGYPVDPVDPARVLVSAATDFETPFVGRLVAGGRVNAEGVDAIVSSPAWHGLEVSSSLSWWRVSQQGLDGVWRRAEYDVRHQARAWISWRPSARWHASSIWRYASGRPYTPFDTRISTRYNTGRYDKTLINAAAGSSYHRLDVRGERVFSLQRAVVVAFAEVDNIYNRDNLYAYTWSRSARAPRAVYQWGLTPVAGVRVEF